MLVYLGDDGVQDAFVGAQKCEQKKSEQQSQCALQLARSK
jgi:hypothetical protein